MIPKNLQNAIQSASHVVGTTWPLYSFVTSNPLSGYENNHFKTAASIAEHNLGGATFPNAASYRQAYEHGEIDHNILEQLLVENHFNETPESYLLQLETVRKQEQLNSDHPLDRILTKWLAAFMDEGLAEWPMPHRNQGFYNSWKLLARFDKDLEIPADYKFPEDSTSAILDSLSAYSDLESQRIIEYQISALPGWTGYIKHREANATSWQKEFPINLEEYLAVRLTIATLLKTELLPKINKAPQNESLKQLKYTWLKAWERSWQHNLIHKLDQENLKKQKADVKQESPDAQMVFCIDTRSELIRRHVEKQGRYETFGYAGFFGIAMDYKNTEDGLLRKSCPPIVSSAYHVSEIPQSGKETALNDYKLQKSKEKFAAYFLKRMKNMLPSAFGYVEGAGLFYGFSLLGRTLLPGTLYRNKLKRTTHIEEISKPKISSCTSTKDSHNDIDLAEKVGIVKSAFDLMGWREFAPLVIFTGHGGHSANNPFNSSLDCGACAASPGRNNARMLAQLANDPSVREALHDNWEITIPTSTVFLGAEHNTTTDEIVLFDAEVSSDHKSQLNSLKQHLKTAQITATQERYYGAKNSVTKAHNKTNNWAETRPEWGLAKNAGCIIGPRSLTKGINLEGNCFLHSYEWEQDEHGTALEGIMQGPMVVTQWINNHYYFSTVDNDKFGGGTKITHNVCGKFGVQQGNGGDLKFGLPLQSVNSSDDKVYHKPLRLSVVIQAPQARIEEILLKNESLKSLLDNEWIYLLVMDPNNDNKINTYLGDLNWELSTAGAEVLEYV
jgi:uncharacterized protein YbcC (UPF0753/DUF2309 family)